MVVVDIFSCFCRRYDFRERFHVNYLSAKKLCDHTHWDRSKNAGCDNHSWTLFYKNPQLQNGIKEKPQIKKFFLPVYLMQQVHTCLFCDGGVVFRHNNAVILID